MKYTHHRLTDDELAALGVQRCIDKNGYLKYEVPCSICGNKTLISHFHPTSAYKCVICQGKLERKREEKKRAAVEAYEREMAEEVGVDYAHYHRFECGVAKFGLEYYPAIKQAETAIRSYESVPEVVACIEILHAGVRVIPHQKLKGYTVDFCLPDIKTIIEIDGALYHTNATKEYWRDCALKDILGDDWEIKHIPSDSVMQKPHVFGSMIKRLAKVRQDELTNTKVDYSAFQDVLCNRE